MVHAAVDDELLTGAVRGFVARQEQRHVCDVDRLTDTTERYVAFRSRTNVGIGSSAGKAGGARSVAAYAASKAGVMTLMKSIANEYAKFGITANALAPALIDTPMIANTRDQVSRIPVGRFGKPEEIVNVGIYLASDESRWTNGANFVVDGGITVNYF